MPRLVSNCFYLICLIALMAVGGCMIDDYPYSDYATTRPEPTDLLGTWVPNSATMQDMKIRGGYPIATHQLILRADGTYSMVDIPDWIFEGVSKGAKNESHHKLITVAGKWHLEKFQDWWAVVFEHKPNDSSIEDLRFNTLAFVCYQKPPHLLHFTLSYSSEGDQGDEAARFERQ